MRNEFRHEYERSSSNQSIFSRMNSFVWWRRADEPGKPQSTCASRAWTNRAILAMRNGEDTVTILHQMQMSGNCYKVRLAAHQLGIALALKEYPFMAGDTRKPEFLA